jgi:hypothetical protein
MPAIALTIVDGTAKFALGSTPPANWTTGNTDASCQVTGAELVPTANTVDVPATFCQGASQTAALSSWALRLAGLQDATETTGLSMFLYTNDAKEGYVQLVGPAKGTTGSKLVTVVAHVTFLAANILGDAGAPLTFEVTIPARDKPTVTQSVAP